MAGISTRTASAASYPPRIQTEGSVTIDCPYKCTEAERKEVRGTYSAVPSRAPERFLNIYATATGTDTYILKPWFRKSANGKTPHMYLYATFTDCVLFNHVRDGGDGQTLPSVFMDGTQDKKDAASVIKMRQEWIRNFPCKTNCWVISKKEPVHNGFDLRCDSQDHWGFYTEAFNTKGGSSPSNLEPP